MKEVKELAEENWIKKITYQTRDRDTVKILKKEALKFEYM